MPSALISSRVNHTHIIHTCTSTNKAQESHPLVLAAGADKATIYSVYSGTLHSYMPDREESVQSLLPCMHSLSRSLLPSIYYYISFVLSLKRTRAVPSPAKITVSPDPCLYLGRSWSPASWPASSLARASCVLSPVFSPPSVTIQGTHHQLQ